MPFWPVRTHKKKLQLEEEQREVGVNFGIVKGAVRRTYKEDKTDKKIEVREPLKELPGWKVKNQELTIKPGEYETINLGHLTEGTALAIETSEIFGSNFSIYLVDDYNFRAFKKTGYAKGAIIRGINISEYQDSMQIRRATVYHIIVASRAIEKNRRVWIRVDLKSLSLS